jgi:8-oxo-dGTP pyrophosphatase MutT (NUDIX family)/phosphohistidine phosphatase SixA
MEAAARPTVALMDVMAAIRAAGGVVWRRERSEDDLEVLLVHRPKYDDWTLPKGKLEPGEDDAAGALREVEEETGLRCELGRPIGTVRYVDRSGRPKVVAYFEMRPGPGVFAVQQEVDRTEWLPKPAALDRLTYEHDRALLDAFDPDRQTGSLYLIRHAEAGERSDWTLPDLLRPLTELGVRQAAALAVRFAGTRITRVISSPAIRCVQSVTPLAADRGLQVEPAEDLIEGAGAERAVGLMLGVSDGPAALCSHGDVIEATIRSLQAGGLVIDGVVGFAKGSVWELRTEAGGVVQARYIAPPR